MFRFIHAADPHLDSPLLGLEAYEGAPVDILRGATRRAFENLVELCIAEQVDFLLVAGDLYDGDWKDYSTGLFFRRQMVRLSAEGIPVYLISGNHDAASVISKKVSLPNNVHEFSTRSAETKLVPGLPVAVHGRGFPSRAVPENLSEEYPQPSKGMFNIGLLHTSLTGRAGHDTYAPCSERDLAAKGYDYWALGHIHQPEIVSRDPWIVFAGNCQGRHVRETGPRGCQLLTVDSASREVVSAEWRSLDVVRWECVTVDLSDADREGEVLDRLKSAVAERIATAEERLLAARLVLVGATPLHGSLQRGFQRWRAEILAALQDFGSDALWLEDVKLNTTPTYDLKALADQDPLTASVLAALTEAKDQADSLPSEVNDMLGVLPPPIRSELESEIDSGVNADTLADVTALLIDSLKTFGKDTL